MSAHPPSPRRITSCLWIASCLWTASCCALPALAQSAPPLLHPVGIAYDAAGNLYVADSARHQVFQATLAGAWLVVAGSGVQGFAGDGGAAASADLNAPQAVIVGADATIYIADTGNQRIRAVRNGIITTIAGNGRAAYSGDNNAATAASLAQPNALALDLTGALLVCDSANHRVRRIANGIITTIAGNGIQGFSGDGGAATSAELDTPSAIAVASSGVVYLADTHNNRVRAIAASGIITTLTAQLAGPRGLAVTAGGAVLVADTDNQRLRSIDASGNITTLAGSGIQGPASDASAAPTAALNSPIGVAISSFGSPTLADTANRTIRILATNSILYLPAALSTGRSSSISLALPASAVYGQGSAAAAVTGTVPVPQGTVQLFDAGTAIAQSPLSGSTATLSLATLSAGAHTLHAVYAGDGLNPSAVGTASSIGIAPAPLLATANPQTIAYGSAIPTLTGTLSGVLPQDAAGVAPLFTTAAQTLSPVGVYPIAASLTGTASANYTVTLSPTSGSLHIVPASTTTLAQPPAQNSFAGLPLLLSATVASATSGAPTGAVNFVEGSSVVASSSLINGTASAAYLSPSAGTHTLSASYSGDANFTASVSPAVSVIVSAMPDFVLAVSGSASQTVQPGSIANYSLTLTAQPAPFSGAVSMSITGLPAGATASFAPPQVVPGSASAGTVLSIQTPAPIVQQSIFARATLCALLLPFFLLPRRRRARRLARCVLLPLLAGALGCGARTATEQTQTSQSYTLTVTGTSTNLAGALIVHNTTVTLNVQ